MQNYSTTMTWNEDVVSMDGWFNLAMYLLDPFQFIIKRVS